MARPDNTEEYRGFDLVVGDDGEYTRLFAPPDYDWYAFRGNFTTRDAARAWVDGYWAAKNEAKGVKIYGR